MTEPRRPQRGKWTDGTSGIALIIGVVGLVAAFWTFRILLSGDSVKLLASDVFLYYLPVYELLYGSLQAGVLPTWNPWQICGLPGLASLQAGFFYPPHVLYLLLPSQLAFALSNLLHLALAAGCTALLVRRLGMGAAAAAVAAIAIGLRGRYPGMVFFPNMLETAAWLPLGAVAVLALARGAGLRAVAALAVCTGLCLLAGYPQLSVYLVYCWGAFLVMVLVVERPGRAIALRALAGLALAVALGAALAAIVLLPGAELAGEGTRTPGILERWQMFPFGWYKGSLAGAFADAVRAPFPALPLSLGGVALVLLPLAFAVRRRRGLAVACALGAGLVALFSMGPATPLFDWLLEIPALGWFRFPRRSLFVFDFFCALGLAIALEALLGRERRERRAREECGERGERGASDSGRTGALAWALLCAAVAIGVAALAGVDAPLWPGLFAVAAAGCVGVVLLGAGGVAGRVASAAPWVLVALLTLELFTAPPNEQRLFYVPGAMKVYAETRPVYERIAASGERAWIRSGGINPPLPPKLASYFHMRSVGDYEPLNLRRQAEYFTYLMEGRLSPKRRGRPYSGRLKHLTAPTYPGALSARGHLLDVAGARWWLVGRKGAARGELEEVIRARGLEEEPVGDADFALLRNPNAVPRAFVVHDLRPAPPPLELLTAMSRPDFDPLQMSYFEAPGDAGLLTGVESEGDLPPPRGRAAEIARDEIDDVEVHAALDAPGMVVLVDSFYPGWHATVDGEEAEILAVNHLFRGVRASAGSHVVRFRYQPTSLRAGSAISLLAAVVIAFLALRRLEPRETGTRQEQRDSGTR